MNFRHSVGCGADESDEASRAAGLCDAFIRYTGKVNWAAVPVPTKNGMDPGQIHTFSDQKSIAMYSSCKSRATAWDFMKFRDDVETGEVLAAST